MLNKPWKKATLIGAVSLILISYIILPLVAQWYIERNSEALTGRQIRLHDLDFNILTGSITVEKLVVFEKDKKSNFFQAEEIYVNMALYQLFIGRLTLTEVSVKQPQVYAIQQGVEFNFDDLMSRFMTEDTMSWTGRCFGSAPQTLISKINAF